MKFLRKFNEGNISMKDQEIHPLSTESNLQEMFGISLEEIKDIVQDILDEGLNAQVNVWNNKQFVVFFEREADLDMEASTWKLPRYLVTDHLDNINFLLKSYGLRISSISNQEDDRKKQTFGVNLFIKLIDGSINEGKNITNPKDNESLIKYFGIDSEEIKDWVQDFLDENVYLSFEVSVISQTHFSIDFYDKEALDSRVPGRISKKTHPFSESNLNVLRSMTSAHKISIDKYNQLNNSMDIVFYANSGQYLSISCHKIL